ncbi:MAG TPA: GntR family transcriptional regulator [Gammaproteobacteria bacterium]|nr:GntR family transcriptional regulator [Gammaproteobacteria bacterium]
MSTGPIQRRALYQQVADRLRKRIYDGELTAGEPIDEKQLCASFGISRTPLREALKVLNSEGLVELVPSRGCFVKHVDFDELHELFVVMAALEGLCAREAVQRSDEADVQRLEGLHAGLEAHAAAGDIDAYYEDNFRFHEALQELSRNRWLQRVAADLRKILRLARHTQLTVEGRLQGSLEEHRRIMDAVRRRDADAVEQCMKEHLQVQLQVLERMQEQQQPATAPADERAT